MLITVKQKMLRFFLKMLCLSFHENFLQNVENGQGNLCTCQELSDRQGKSEPFSDLF